MKTSESRIIRAAKIINKKEFKTERLLFVALESALDNLAGVSLVENHSVSEYSIPDTLDLKSTGYTVREFLTVTDCIDDARNLAHL